VIIFFYGGTWETGSKTDYLFVAQALAAQGAVVVVPDYRLYPQVTFPAFLDDGAAATAWTFQNIGRYGGDSKTVFLAGHSAGAYIAVMLALDPAYLKADGIATSRLAGTIGISGPYDFLPIIRPDVKAIFDVVPDLATTQPIHYARADAPPLLLLQGEADKTVGPFNTRNLGDRIRALGGKVETDFYPGANHIDTVIAMTALFKDRAPVLRDIEAFIASHAHDAPGDGAGEPKSRQEATSAPSQGNGK
jgi:acetyl esterase/lipase